MYFAIELGIYPQNTKHIIFKSYMHIYIQGSSKYEDRIWKKLILNYMN